MSPGQVLLYSQGGLLCALSYSGFFLKVVVNGDSRGESPQGTSRVFPPWPEFCIMKTACSARSSSRTRHKCCQGGIFNPFVFIDILYFGVLFLGLRNEQWLPLYLTSVPNCPPPFPDSPFTCLSPSIALHSLFLH